ncbi:MAG: hypothetical protein Roseis2KO_34030 [Roseivirga sp.]
MVSFLRKLRHNLIPKTALGKYFFYALGEIVLVVVGILIALSINNWNEERQQKQKVDGMFVILKDDIENDLKDAAQVLEYYRGYEDEFVSLMKGTMSFEEFRDCPQCAYLVTGHRSFNIELRGYESLKRFYSTHDEDTLVNQIVQRYTSSLNNIDSNDDLIRESIAADLVIWRNQYDWFTQFALAEDHTAYAEYATSSKEFRNMTAWRYALIYANYVPAVETFEANLKDILTNIEKRLSQ